MVRRVVVEVSDEVAKFLTEEFYHTDDLAEVIKYLLNEGASEVGLFFFTDDDLKVKEVKEDV